jgi:L-cysteine:1D-myo-inositol 2-amino-2-deoxy-alpha-D-glucopyranoside ligase
MGVYVCGITPYDAAHAGHAFTYVHFDVLVRYLRHLGAEVRHVQNVTDVDDDMLRTARERGEDYLELAEREIRRFERDMRAIGVVPPWRSPRATDHVPQMVEEVRALVDAGHGYERGGTVYFPVASDPRYGRLSGYAREEMVTLAAERGGFPDDPNKDDPLDFVLWQRSAEGEPAWDSPWGPGRPGWHIECSTMARRLLGQPVDVHGGGSDLIYPHHESELAQAEAVQPDPPFVRTWMHTGTVAYRGDKMSKSLGNLVFARDLLERFPATAVRRSFLRHHYREDWEFREEEVTAEHDPGEGPASREAFFAALDDDLDVPVALEILERAERTRASWTGEGRSILGLDPA